MERVPGSASRPRRAGKRAADEALRLQPTLPEAHVALGVYYYRAKRDYGRALEEFARADSSRPDDAGTVLFIAAVQRRQGRWEEAGKNWARVAVLDPRSPLNTWDAAITLIVLERYTERRAPTSGL